MLVLLRLGENVKPLIMQTFNNDSDLAAAVASLVLVEPRFEKVLQRHGLPPLRRSEPGLRGLLRIVTDQLISLKAAEAIWRRVEGELHLFDPAMLAQMPESRLMELGLSGAKARTFRVASQAVLDGRLRLDLLQDATDLEVLKALRSIKGIGPWTADIYLLSALGRCDAWPGGDLALQIAAQDLLGLQRRPMPLEMADLAEAWRPRRSAAARLLWSHYRGLRGLPQTVT